MNNNNAAEFRYSSPVTISLVIAAALAALFWTIQNAPVAPQPRLQGPVLSATPGDSLNLAFSYSVSAR